MKHVFLDFDRTLFNTEAFYTALEHFYLQGIIKRRIGTDFSQFLYEDGYSFMCNAKARGITCYILTYGDKSIQSCKVELSLLLPYCKEVFYVEQGSKASAIKEYVSSLSVQDHCYFIDDTASHLVEMQKNVPRMTLFHMKRKGAKGSEQSQSDFTVIASLEEVGI
jgi:FMN phosphatase YigB (HAD superfamily)